MRVEQQSNTNEAEEKNKPKLPPSPEEPFQSGRVTSTTDLSDVSCKCPSFFETGSTLQMWFFLGVRGKTSACERRVEVKKVPPPPLMTVTRCVISPTLFTPPRPSFLSSPLLSGEIDGDVSGVQDHRCLGGSR